MARTRTRWPFFARWMLSSEVGLVSRGDALKKMSGAPDRYDASLEIISKLNADDIAALRVESPVRQKRPPRRDSRPAKINKASKHLLTLINDILDISKIEAGRMELCLETVMVADLILPLRVRIRWSRGFSWSSFPLKPRLQQSFRNTASP